MEIFGGRPMLMLTNIFKCSCEPQNLQECHYMSLGCLLTCTLHSLHHAVLNMHHRAWSLLLQGSHWAKQLVKRNREFEPPGRYIRIKMRDGCMLCLLSFCTKGCSSMAEHKWTKGPRFPAYNLWYKRFSSCRVERDLMLKPLSSTVKGI